MQDALAARAFKHMVLVGGGHAHVLVLDAFAARPEPNVRLTLVSKEALTPYSGMLPGHLAGAYARDEIHIDLERLALRCGADWVPDEALGFDPERRRVLLRHGPSIAYDLLSIDIGITPDLSGIEGAERHGLAVKPIGALLPKWDRLLAAAARTDGPRRIAVVGGGAAGICLAFAASAAVRARARHEVSVCLIDAGDAPGINPAMARRIRRALKRRGIALYEGARAAALDGDGITLSDGERVAADACLIATGAAPPPAFRDTPFPKDSAGFLAVGPTLEVPGFPGVFAAGDCAAVTAYPRPKAGVFAVRQGPVLARNLRRAARGEALLPHVPQRGHLTMIGTGDGRAVGGRGRWLAFEGRWAWRLKVWLDRRFMRQFRCLPP